MLLKSLLLCLSMAIKFIRSIIFCWLLGARIYPVRYEPRGELITSSCLGCVLIDLNG